MRFFIILTLLIGSAQPLYARPTGRLELHYTLQQIEPTARQKKRLQNFLNINGKQQYYLVQGFACNTGGYKTSLQVATARALSLQNSLIKFIPLRQIHSVQGTVVHSGKRANNRRAIVMVFTDQSEWQQASLAAQDQSEKYNQATRQSEDKHIQTVDPGISPRSAVVVRQTDPAYWLWVLLLLATPGFLFLFYILWRQHLTNEKDPVSKKIRPEELSPHRISAAEKKVFESIINKGIATGNAGPTASLTDHNESIRDFLDHMKGGTPTMAKKKKQTSSNKQRGFSFQHLLDREFEAKSLKELVESPVHALEGLTPRHSRLLEEAFGIKNISDLAQLKYIDLARALVVLADYEK